MKEFNAAFWRWFGDSKVVDGLGNPLVVYHGTKASFDVFDMSFAGNFSSHWAKEYSKAAGFFFSDSKKVALAYAERVQAPFEPVIMSVYLRMENPFLWDDAELRATDISPGPVLKSLTRAFVEIKKRGHDGVIWSNVLDRGGEQTQFIVFKPNQIKSAIDNDGTFDDFDPSIRSNPRRKIK